VSVRECGPRGRKKRAARDACVGGCMLLHEGARLAGSWDRRASDRVFRLHPSEASHTRTSMAGWLAGPAGSLLWILLDADIFVFFRIYSLSVTRVIGPRAMTNGKLYFQSTSHSSVSFSSTAALIPKVSHYPENMLIIRFFIFRVLRVAGVLDSACSLHFCRAGYLESINQ
jgi:hypothetical protein